MTATERINPADYPLVVNMLGVRVGRLITEPRDQVAQDQLTELNGLIDDVGLSAAVDAWISGMRILRAIVKQSLSVRSLYEVQKGNQ